MTPRVHALRTGSVQIKRAQMASVGSGSARLVHRAISNRSGHTPGHVSVLVKGTPSFFLAGDTSYTEELLRQRHVDGVSPDEAVARDTIDRILRLAGQEPLVYLPSHDPDSATRLNRHTVLIPPQ